LRRPRRRGGRGRVRHRVCARRGNGRRLGPARPPRRRRSLPHVPALRPGRADVPKRARFGNASTGDAPPRRNGTERRTGLPSAPKCPLPTPLGPPLTASVRPPAPGLTRRLSLKGSRRRASFPPPRIPLTGRRRRRRGRPRPMQGRPSTRCRRSRQGHRRSNRPLGGRNRPSNPARGGHHPSRPSNPARGGRHPSRPSSRARGGRRRTRTHRTRRRRGLGARRRARRRRGNRHRRRGAATRRLGCIGWRVARWPWAD
jgi:hypothetical protein